MSGAGLVKEKFLTSFYEASEKCLKSYKHLAIQARTDGNMAERLSDSILFLLYISILKWSIESNNIFAWYWTCCQWIYMARCASVDSLRFHNFSIGQDIIIIKYENSKYDKMVGVCCRRMCTQILTIIIFILGLVWESVIR